MPAGYTAKVFDTKGKEPAPDALLGTGSKIEILNDEVESFKTMYLVIYGDINGDGKISSSDYVLMAQHILGKNAQSGAPMMALDVKWQWCREFSRLRGLGQPYFRQKQMIQRLRRDGKKMKNEIEDPKKRAYPTSHCRVYFCGAGRDLFDKPIPAHADTTAYINEKQCQNRYVVADSPARDSIISAQIRRAM